MFTVDGTKFFASFKTGEKEVSFKRKGKDAKATREVTTCILTNEKKDVVGQGSVTRLHTDANNAKTARRKAFKAMVLATFPARVTQSRILGAYYAQSYRSASRAKKTTAASQE